MRQAVALNHTHPPWPRHNCSGEFQMNTTVDGRSSGLTRALHLDRAPAEALPISTGGLAPWQKRRVMDLLTRHLAENVSVRSLARECGLSTSHFGRAFKTSFGVSAHRWFVERRIERSKELLLQTHESLVDVADQTGFADQAAFTRTFRRLVGVSPGRWRRYQTTVVAKTRLKCEHRILLAALEART